MKIDLNCDMGESFGSWKMGRDSELMRYVSSASIACGFHAGDATVMRRTIEAAMENGVSIGAHPSYPDLQGFGRREMNLSPQEITDIVLYQISAIKGMCESLGARLNHVKPHGALYNSAARCESTSKAIAEAVASIDRDLIVFGLAGGQLTKATRSIGLQSADEAFADRRYESDGSLTPRKEEDALLTDPSESAEQVLRFVLDKTVATRQGPKIEIAADTVCIHGDGKNALAIAIAVREKLEKAGVTVAALARKEIS